jgi:hypothetical protein
MKAEVLGKRVVVQHIPLGGFMEWEASGDRNSCTHDTRQQMKPTLGPPVAIQGQAGLNTQSRPPHSEEYDDLCNPPVTQL